MSNPRGPWIALSSDIPNGKKLIRIARLTTFLANLTTAEASVVIGVVGIFMVVRLARSSRMW